MGMPSDVRIKPSTADSLKHNQLSRRASGTPEMRREGSGGGGGGVAVMRRVDGSPKSVRRMSAPELPPIGAKPNSPGYSAARAAEPSYANRKAEAQKRPPPLSPTSSAVSLTSIARTNSWLASDLSSSMQSGRLETLFEGMDSSSPRAKAAAGADRNGHGLADDRKPVVWSVGEQGSGGSAGKPPISRAKITIEASLTSPKSRSPLDDNRNVLPPKPPASAVANGVPATVGLPAASPTLSSRLSQENLYSLLKNSTTGGGAQQDSYDSDKDKDERIMEWLVAVKNSSDDAGGDIPEISPIETEEKRDTAIHIVYNGD